MDERRLTPRTKLTQIVYVNLQSGNGGILIDASPAGIGFQAAGRIDPNAPFFLHLSAWSTDEIEPPGELIWLDVSGKRGGLRFSDLSSEAHDRIKLWLSDLSSLVVRAGDHADSTDSNVPSQPEEPSEPFQVQGDEFFPDSANPSASTATTQSPPPPFVENSVASYAADPPASFSPRASSQSPPHSLPSVSAITPHRSDVQIFQSYSGAANERSDKRPAFARGRTTVILLALAGVVSCFLLGYGSRRLVMPGAQPRDGAAYAKRVPIIDVGPTAAPAVAPQSSSDLPAITATTPPIPSSPDARTLKTNIPASRTSPPSEAVLTPPTDTSQAELERAQAILHEAGTGQRAAAIELLWDAVGKGSVEAEIVLADLYVQGVGIPAKNCEQARVLLTAAQTHGNEVATQKLAELPNNGCP
jgi:PilZ domain